DGAHMGHLVADRGHAEDDQLPMVQLVHLGDRHIPLIAEAVHDGAHHLPLVLQAARLAHEQALTEGTDDHGVATRAGWFRRVIGSTLARMWTRIAITFPTSRCSWRSMLRRE